MEMSENKPILTITTSKNWVLPPRPKNVRKTKPTAEKKKANANASAKANANAKAPGVKPSSKALKGAAKTYARTSSKESLKGCKGSGKDGLDIGDAFDGSMLENEDSLSPEPLDPSPLECTEQLSANIKLIDQENYQLKTKLLSLIHDYKSLKSLVISPTTGKVPPVGLLYDTTTTARKRVYQEMGDPMSDLISDMSGLLYSTGSVMSPLEPETDAGEFDTELLNFLNLEQDSQENDMSEDILEKDLQNSIENSLENTQNISEKTSLEDSLELIKEDFGIEIPDYDVEMKLPNVSVSGDLADIADLSDLADLESLEDLACLSRSVSLASDSDENSLMTNLTRSTTISTTNSISEKKPMPQFKFHDLPEFFEDDYLFSFEKPLSSDNMMAVIEEDNYNQVADFLEEKLISNDVKYYVETSNG